MTTSTRTSPASPCDLSANVRQDSEGRYCLNDLHKAAGGEDKHRPNYFLNRVEVDDLRFELKKDWEQKAGIPAIKTEAGRYGGTYVPKELVYAYAMWVSPAFHLKVIRFFDRGVKDGVAVADHAAADLLANPLGFFEKVLAQAKVLQAERDTLKEANRVLEQKRAALAHVNEVLAPQAAALAVISGENGRSLGQFVRTLKGVNSMAVKKDLLHCDRLYKRGTGYRVRHGYKDYYLERFGADGKADIFVTAKGMADIATLLKAGKLTMCRKK